MINKYISLVLVFILMFNQVILSTTYDSSDLKYFGQSDGSWENYRNYWHIPGHVPSATAKGPFNTVVFERYGIFVYGSHDLVASNDLKL